MISIGLDLGPRLVGSGLRVGFGSGTKTGVGFGGLGPRLGLVLGVWDQDYLTG